jgi:hypothetical protein
LGLATAKVVPGRQHAQAATFDGRFVGFADFLAWGGE